jgi:hypothetical protein
MAHDCPVRGCARTGIPDDYLTCGPDWHRADDRPDLQRAVYREYAGGAGLLPSGLPSPPLAEAQRAVIDHIEARRGLPPRGSGPVSQRGPAPR